MVLTNSVSGVHTVQSGQEGGLQFNMCILAQTQCPILIPHQSPSQVTPERNEVVKTTRRGTFKEIVPT